MYNVQWTFPSTHCDNIVSRTEVGHQRKGSLESKAELQSNIGYCAGKEPFVPRHFKKLVKPYDGSHASVKNRWWHEQQPAMHGFFQKAAQNGSTCIKQGFSESCELQAERKV